MTTGPETPATPFDRAASTDLTGGAQTQDLLHLLSHDIRSAMSDVIGGLRLIDTGRLDPQTHTQIARVHAAANTLARLVDDALLTASGETAIAQDDHIDLPEWLDALNNRWRGRAAERGGRFEIDQTGAMPKRLAVSRLVLDRIIGNLVGNALIHVPGGDVKVGVIADAHSGITLCIEDTGAGFPAQVLDSFSARGGAQALGETGGSGLGLRIASGLSQQIGAVLDLFNDPCTGGATAVVHLPPELMIADDAPQTSSMLPDLSGFRILVAEDNLTNQNGPAPNARPNAG